MGRIFSGSFGDLIRKTAENMQPLGRAADKIVAERIWKNRVRETFKKGRITPDSVMAEMNAPQKRRDPYRR